MPGIPKEDYETCRMQVRYIARYGDREQLEALYHAIRDRFGETEDLYRLDREYNTKWQILDLPCEERRKSI